MFLAPDAALDDGLLDVVTIAGQSRAALPARPRRASSRARTSTTRRSTSSQAREITFSADRPFTAYADGDPIAELPVTVRVLPGALRVVAPR